MGWFLLIVFTVLGAASATAVIHEMRDHHRLMVMCQSDGHKEYECQSMLMGHATAPVVTPVFIHMGKK